MSLPVLLLLIAGPLLLIVIVLAASAQAQARVDTRSEWRWVRVVWAAALVAGGIAAWLVNGLLDLGRGMMLVPAVLGLSVVAGVGLAESVVRPQRPTGARTASLSPRRVVHYLPRTLGVAVAGIATLHLGTLALTTVTASADDMGRAGRSIAAQCGTTGSAAGPYPGSFYSAPLALLLLLIGLVASASLSAVVRRPRGFAPDETTCAGILLTTRDCNSSGDLRLDRIAANAMPMLPARPFRPMVCPGFSACCSSVGIPTGW